MDRRSMAWRSGEMVSGEDAMAPRFREVLSGAHGIAWRFGGALVGAMAASACVAVPPPPIIPMHSGTEAAPRDRTVAMLVVGVVHAGNSIFGGAEGIGVALRVEHQTYDDTALGVQLGGGHGSHGDTSHTLLAAEGYGRTSLADWTAVTYGAGLSWFSTGLWTLSAHGGAAASVPNDYAVPVVQVALAGVVPVVPGAAFGTRRTGEREPSVPTSELFATADASLVVPLASTGNRISVDVGVAAALTNDHSVLALSVADAQR